MKALLLAAGCGTRLRPLTETIPKCLVPIGGQPLLGIWLQRLLDVGIGPFLVNTHYLAPQVQAFIEAQPYHQQVTLAEEPKLQGTAGTLIANLGFFQGEDALLIHADNYCMANLRAFLDAHRRRPSHCWMTMMTFRTATPSSCGIVELDAQGVVVGFHEKVAQPPGNLANGAIYALDGRLLKALATRWRHAIDFSTEILPALTGHIFTHETSAHFLDIGTPVSYALANQWAFALSAPLSAAHQCPPPLTN